jgi:hypothetical protein
MYRLFPGSASQNWFTLANEAAVYSGIHWVPRTRRRQVRLGASWL